MNPKFGYPATAEDYREKARARGVMIGRPWAWALAGGGEAGLTRLLKSWQQELRLAMTLTGVTRIADIGTDQLDRSQQPEFPKAGEQQ
ncbi:MAG: alpha-hydroxy-acid oxidizing protein [Marinobacter sp.]